MEGFGFANADEAMKFYEACSEAKADTYEKRVALLRQWVKEKKATYIPHPEDVINGHNVRDMKKGNLKDGTN